MNQREIWDLAIVAWSCRIFHGEQRKNILTLKFLEKTRSVLTKVKISGGGRCNITHHQYDPQEFVKNYPRGSKELLGPMHRFGAKEMVAWLQNHGIELKTEKDGRMFPTTNTSHTIIDLFFSLIQKYNVIVKTKIHVKKIEKADDFYLYVDDDIMISRNLALCTGSSPYGHQIAKNFGHTIVQPVASLFTFTIPHFSLSHLSGITAMAKLWIPDTKFHQSGSLLITHFGFSGPAALKLSAFAARYFSEKKYNVNLCINWVQKSYEETFHTLQQSAENFSGKAIGAASLFSLPKNLWKTFIEIAKITPEQKWNHTSTKELSALSHLLTYHPFSIEGKTTHKEEFVTAGGVDRREIDFRSMESKKCPRLFFSGEIIDIDGVTGGFNFQAAWTASYLVADAITVEKQDDC